MGIFRPARQTQQGTLRFANKSVKVWLNRKNLRIALPNLLENNKYKKISE